MVNCGLTSSQMAFTLSPTSGPRGTTVTLKVSGCVDPAGNSHALGYQVDSTPVVAIPSTRRGTSLMATFRVNGATGRISARCLDTVVTRTFTVTGG